MAGAKPYIGILLEGGTLDRKILGIVKGEIRATIVFVGEQIPPINKIKVSSALGVHRNRLNRLLDALDMSDYYEEVCKKYNGYEKDAHT